MQCNEMKWKPIWLHAQSPARPTGSDHSQAGPGVREYKKTQTDRHNKSMWTFSLLSFLLFEPGLLFQIKQKHNVTGNDTLDYSVLLWQRFGGISSARPSPFLLQKLWSTLSVPIDSTAAIVFFMLYCPKTLYTPVHPELGQHGGAIVSNVALQWEDSWIKPASRLQLSVWRLHVLPRVRYC